MATDVMLRISPHGQVTLNGEMAFECVISIIQFQIKEMLFSLLSHLNFLREERSSSAEVVVDRNTLKMETS